MYKGSAALDRALDQKGGRTFNATLVFDNQTINANQIKKVTYRGGSNLTSDIAIGTTTMASVEIVTTVSRVPYAEFALYIGVMLENGTFENVPMGFFTVTETVESGNITTITAVDRMAKLNKLYVPQISYFPTNTGTVLNDITNQTGVVRGDYFAYGLNIATKEQLQGYTCREIVGYIAARYGMFACFDRQGRLVFKWYPDENNAITQNIDRFYRFDKSNYFTIGKVTFHKDSETEYTYGDGTTGIVNSNPLCEETDAQRVFEEITSQNSGYDVVSTEFLGDIRLDAWDKIYTQYIDDTDYYYPCMALTHIITGGCTTLVSSVGKTETDTDSDYTGPVVQSLNRTFAELMAVNRLVADKANITDLNAANANIENLQANAANINTLMFGSATGDKLTTTFANAVIAVLGNAQIKSQQVLDLSADKINAGTLNTNNVNVQSNDGKLSIVGNDIILKDTTNTIRVKIGKVGNDYDFNLFDTDGNLMFSAAGISEDAIKQAIIDNAAVKEGANIDAGKLDISTLFSVINEDGTNTLKATKVKLDKENATLEAAFNSMTETVGTLGSTVSTQGSSIEANTQAIVTKVWQTDITNVTDPMQSTIDTHTTQISQNANSIGFMVSYNQQTGKFEITPEAMNLIAQEINLTGKVNFNSFTSELQQNFNDVSDTADGAYDKAEANEKSIIADNLIATPYYNNKSVVSNKVTFTYGDDGIITANGTASGGPATFYIRGRSEKWFPKAGKYTFSCCPEGGAVNKYYAYGTYGNAGTRFGDVNQNDYGDGMVGTLPDLTGQSNGLGFYIVIANGYTCNNLQFKPMFEVGETKHEFQPRYLARDYVFTPNTTTIDGGKITANTIKADSIDVNDLFAQNINVTGQIKGDDIEVNGGNIGGWKVDNTGALYKKTYRTDETGTHYYSVVLQNDGSIVYYNLTKAQYDGAAITSTDVLYALNNLGEVIANKGSIGGVNIGSGGLTTGNVSMGNQEITITNLADGGAGFNKVTITNNGFRFYENDIYKGSTVWKAIWDLRG